MNLSDATLHTLEFDKLREGIAIRAASELGQEEILAMKPCADTEIIQTLLKPVVEATHMIAFEDPVSLSRVPNIRSSLERSGSPGSMLLVPELLQVAEVLSDTRRLDKYITKRCEKYPALCDIISGLSPQQNLEKTLSNSLDHSAETVRDSASIELRKLRRSIEQRRGDIREKVESMANSLGDSVLQDRLVTIRNGRLVIPVKENQKGSVQGISHDQSATGQTLFIEPMVSVEIGNKLRQLEHSEKREIERILRMLTKQVAAVSDKLQRNLAILAKFDAIYAKAIYCRDLECTQPVFNDSGRFMLRGARHPLLELRMRTEDREKELIPLELELGTDEYWTLLLTGPNAGGKTVALKTVGLLSLMAQTGLLIPARENSELPILSGIFADIGDKQSIENDLSTFSSHASNLGKICDEADSKSLVLLDEIGSSTDPDQGSALAMSLLGTLTERQTRTIATTHHGALKAYAHDSDGVENGSMAFDSETLEPTFRLQLKVPGSSYAFEIARRFGVPSKIVDKAAEIAGSDVGKVESLIQNLEETCRAYQERLEKVEVERDEIYVQKEIFHSRMADVERREHKLKRSSEEGARQILEGANALIEKTVQDIRQSKADSSSIRRAHTTIANAKARFDKTAPPETKIVPVLEGDSVFIRRLGKKGTVINAPGTSGRIMVQVGTLRVEVSPSEVEICQNNEDTPPKKKSETTPNRNEEISLDVDLRGLTVDEASEVVDKYVYDLSHAGMERATIIHGKGTGVLRQKIGDFLRKNPLVSGQRLGSSGEGGDGVTIIELNKDK
ncbi:MAG: endonuclease MutS2 [Candidatus Latescibacterota bacterium]|nr:endonuclease MutS2 [Candidatus Latescibacterota bacterium]